MNAISVFILKRFHLKYKIRIQNALCFWSKVSNGRPLIDLKAYCSIEAKKIQIVQWLVMINFSQKARFRLYAKLYSSFLRWKTSLFSISQSCHSSWNLLWYSASFKWCRNLGVLILRLHAIALCCLDARRVSVHALIPFHHEMDQKLAFLLSLCRPIIADLAVHYASGKIGIRSPCGMCRAILLFLFFWWAVLKVQYCSRKIKQENTS